VIETGETQTVAANVSDPRSGNPGVLKAGPSGLPVVFRTADARLRAWKGPGHDVWALPQGTNQSVLGFTFNDTRVVFTHNLTGNIFNGTGELRALSLVTGNSVRLATDAWVSVLYAGNDEAMNCLPRVDRAAPRVFYCRCLSRDATNQCLSAELLVSDVFGQVTRVGATPAKPGFLFDGDTAFAISGSDLREVSASP
jgi:hypothetical protein